MSQQRNRGDNHQRIRVIAERRERPDHTMLSTALFGWVMDSLRAERRQQVATEPTAVDTQVDGADS